VKLKSEGAGEREAAGLELSRNIVNQHTVLATPSQSLLAVLYMMLPLPEHGCVRPCFRTIKSNLYPSFPLTGMLVRILSLKVFLTG
jgi:hypothetical protein